MHKTLAILIVFLLLANIGAISMVHAQTPHQIAMDAAITKGIDYLNMLQAPDGHIGESWYVGETGLYILALLDHNISKNDPHVLNATNYILSRVQIDGSIYQSEPNYETAGAIMALEALQNSTLLPTISNAASYVLSSQAPDGSFGYSAGAGSGDLSNSQYSILGLKSAELAGWVPPSSTPYTKLANWVKTQQNVDGGYCTYGYTTSSGAGTSAALICLSLAGVPLGDSSIQGGITWLKNNFSYTTNPGYDWLGAYYYYLYGAMKALTFCGITNQVGGVMDPTTAANPGVAGDRGWHFDFSEHLIVTQYGSGDWHCIPRRILLSHS